MIGRYLDIILEFSWQGSGTVGFRRYPFFALALLFRDNQRFQRHSCYRHARAHLYGVGISNRGIRPLSHLHFSATMPNIRMTTVPCFDILKLFPYPGFSLPRCLRYRALHRRRSRCDHNRGFRCSARYRHYRRAPDRLIFLYRLCHIRTPLNFS